MARFVPITLRWPAECRECYRDLEQGTDAYYRHGETRCQACQERHDAHLAERRANRRPRRPRRIATA